MATAQEYKRRLEEIAKGPFRNSDWLVDQKAAAWALKEIEFLQNKCKELRALIPSEPAA